MVAITEVTKQIKSVKLFTNDHEIMNMNQLNRLTFLTAAHMSLNFRIDVVEDMCTVSVVVLIKTLPLHS